jgi:ubiquinone/menaquinone biosynthesis C-methylase UbiE
MTKKIKSAKELHKKVPPDWYYQSTKLDFSKWYSPFQMYWHNKRFSVVGKLIEPSGGNVLDIGCADGMFTKTILDKSKAKNIVGVDVLDTSVRWANKHWKNNKKLSFKVGDAHKLKFKNDTFDAVFALEVLEHVYKPDVVLKEVKRVLKKNGYAVFLVPTDVWYFKFLWDNFWTKTRGSIWDDTHLHSYTNDDLVKLCKKVGFRVEINNKFLLGMLQAVKIRKV